MQLILIFATLVFLWNGVTPSFGDTWTATVFVGDVVDAQTNSPFFIDVDGSTGSGTNISVGDHFVRGEQTSTTFDGCYGDIESVRIFQYLPDALYLDKLTLTNGVDSYEFYCSCWIETDETSVSSWTLAPLEDWTVSVFVGDVTDAESTGEFFIDVFSTTGSERNISLGGNFARNAKVDIPLKKAWGKINSIRFFQGTTDGLYLVKVVISNGKRSYNFDCNCWVDMNETETPSFDLNPSK